MDIAAFLALCLLLTATVWLLWKVDWKAKLDSPTVIAALVAGSAALAVALTGAISGVISSHYQSAAEVEKTRMTVLLDILQHYDPSLVPDRNLENQKQRMKIMIQSGIVADESGSICMALIQDGCPIKVLKRN